MSINDKNDKKTQQIISNAFELLLILPFVYGGNEMSSF
jgi:hypothetical protein